MSTSDPERFVADFDDLNMRAPDVESILQWIGEDDLVDADEAAQRTAIVKAAQERRLAPLQVLTLRDLGWLPARAT